MPLDMKTLGDIKQYVAALTISLKGDLDTELKRLNEATAEWDKRTKLDQATKDLAASQAQHADAKANFAAFKEQAESTLQVWEGKLKTREAEIEAKLKSIAEREAALLAKQNVHDSTTQATSTAFAKQGEELTQRKSALDNLAAGLHLRELKVAEREAKVESVMAKLNMEWRA